MTQRILCALALLLAAGLAQAQSQPQPQPQPQSQTFAPELQSALEQAAQRRLPVLVVFRAPWCYSCYYMARHVHTGAEWQALQARAVVVELDADNPEGGAQMQAWGLKPLPAYVVLDARGIEVGRMLGEMRREAFYAQVDALLGPRAGLDDLRATARAGGRKGRAAADAALAAFYARNDAAGGIKWFYDLPGSVRRAYEPDAALMLRLARLRLMEAAESLDIRACATAAGPVFAGDLGCERPYEVKRYQSCIADAAGDYVPDALLRAQREPMQQLVDQRVLGQGETCADERSAVLGLADLYRALGDGAAQKALLTRAIENLRARLGTDLGADRSAADNLRVYIEQVRDWNAYDELMPRLIATWPDDYVYAFRYGRSLLERDHPSRALPYLERAAARAYGENRLRVAEQRVKALKRLGRADDARRVAAEALKANGPWFPERVAALKAQL